MQARQATARKLCGCDEWINARDEESFGGVNVSQPRDLRLIQKHLFQSTPRTLECRPKIIGREFVRERLWSQSAQLFGCVQLGGFDYLHQTEMSLVGKD